MRSVSIINAGITSFGERCNSSFKDLVVEVADTIDISKIEAIYSGCMAAGKFVGQDHVGALIADKLGLSVPSTRVEAACASGGVALRSAFISVAGGEHDVVVVIGVDKMTDVSTAIVTSTLGGAGDQETELFHGATFPALYALLARIHMHEFGTTEEQLAAVAVKNHKNALNNPYAHFRREITISDVMNSSYVATPLKLLDCSPISDGAAAVVLCASDIAKKFCERPIQILACEHASDSLALTGRASLTELRATILAAQKAYSRAGILPKDVDVAEVHDCFTIAEILATEDLGFFKKGYGGMAAENGETQLGGKIAVNPSGGLKAKGHPVGATGIAQVVEIYKQLRGEANCQVNAKIGLAHNIGGSGATAVVTILR